MIRLLEIAEASQAPSLFSVVSFKWMSSTTVCPSVACAINQNPDRETISKANDSSNLIARQMMVPEKSAGLDDLVLLRQAAGGENPGALNEILIKYREGLRRMIAIRMSQELQGRLDASDVVQDTFIEATRALDAYLKNPVMPVKLWLRHLAGQKLTQAHRVHLAAQKRAVEREQPLDGGAPGVNSESLAFELIANSATPSQIAVRNETKDRLMHALNEMTEADREVLTLRHFEHLNSQETADILGMSNDAVKKRYVRALEKLQRILQEDA